MKWFYDARKSLLGRLVLSILVIWIPFTALVLGGLVIVSKHLTKETINNQTDKVKYYSAIINADIERVICRLTIPLRNTGISACILTMSLSICQNRGKS